MIMSHCHRLGWTLGFAWYTPNERNDEIISATPFRLNVLFPRKSGGLEQSRGKCEIDSKHHARRVQEPETSVQILETYQPMRSPISVRV